MGAIGNVGHLLYNAGASIISGFLDGLNKHVGFRDGLDFRHRRLDNRGTRDARNTDAVMLVNNGRLIMQGFAKGLRSGFDTDVRRTISRINGRMGGLSLDAGMNGGTVGGTVVNVTFNAPVDR